MAKLSHIRIEVESELEDLTASLFEEANNMVYNANILRSRAEKELFEANLKIDVLMAEVQALKMLQSEAGMCETNMWASKAFGTSITVDRAV